MSINFAHRRLFYFLAVGCTAAAVHWVTVVALVRQYDWRPLLANVSGWLVAFLVSFAGHHRLTFHGHGATLTSAGLRFFMVSAAGFLANEFMFAVLLRWTNWPVEPLLAMVLVAIAVMTYVLSRRWAFRGSGGHGPRQD